ncbi:MAG TPA: HD domain-containing phosphohydrolase [Nitrospiria bacterium]|jgi:HD-GYP domain-containing protein (c-di-GMP phosphodiesterase class II)
MYQIPDTLGDLNKNAPLAEKLTSTHTALKRQYDFIDRISVALYDPKTDLLKTFIHSSGTDEPLGNYQAVLRQVGSLQEILQTGHPRVVNDLEVFGPGKQEHTLRIAAQGYGASYTMPMFLNGMFFGFVFFNSYQKNCFGENVLHTLNVFGHLISLIILSDLTNFRTMLATVKAARDMAFFHDNETGAHLDRMAHYSRLIAKTLAPKYRLDDELIEHIFLFSPLHDIGKIRIPDRILQKTDKLTQEEYQIMKGHAIKGREIIDTILRDFGLESLHHIDVLRNIAEFHHEAINGRGYPHGLVGERIPIEARIIAVADMFDALTSKRPYKEAWPNEVAFNLLKELAGVRLDRDCVEALIQNRSDIEKIQIRFKEELYS